MDKQLAELIYDSVNKLTLDPNRPMVLSYNRMKRFQNCPAGYLYEYVILPKIANEASIEITRKGTNFHLIAEHEFDKTKMATILDDSPEEEKVDIDNYIEYTKTIPYVDDTHSCETRLQYKLNDSLSYLGIIDRLYDTNTPVRIVDWKTTMYRGNMPHDRKQCLGYTFLVNKVKHIKPEDIISIVEYVALKESHEYSFTKSDIIYFENYVRSVHSRIVNTERDFLASKSMKGIRHIRGNCTFCAMKGGCRAYQILINPVDYIDDISQFSTEELATEYYKFDDAAEMTKTRADTLKLALMERYNNGDKSVESFVYISPGNKSESYDSTGVLSEILNKSVTKAKRIEFAELIDWPTVKDALAGELIKVLPKRLKPASVPEDIRKKSSKYLSVSRGNPYLRKKS